MLSQSFRAPTRNPASSAFLDSASEFLGLVSPEWIVSVAEAIESHTLFGITPVLLVNSLGSIIEYVGFVILVLLCFDEALRAKLPRISEALSKIKRWDVD